MAQLSAGPSTSWALNQDSSWSKESVSLPKTLEILSNKYCLINWAIAAHYMHWTSDPEWEKAGKHFQYSSLAVVLPQSWWNWLNCPAVLLAPPRGWRQNPTQPMKDLQSLWQWWEQLMKNACVGEESSVHWGGMGGRTENMKHVKKKTRGWGNQSGRKARVKCSVNNQMHTNTKHSLYKKQTNI